MDVQTRNKLFWAVVIAAIFTALLLYMVDWTHFSVIAGRAVKKYLVFAFLMLLASNIVRSFRFYTLDHRGNRFTSWLVINKIYNFMTATLPGGVGEAATAFVITRHSLLNMLSALRILILSRIMDLAGLSALLLFAAIQMDESTDYRGMSIWLSCALLLVSTTAMIPATERYVLNLTHKLPGQNRLMQWVRRKLAELTEISEAHRGGPTFTATLLQSLLIMVGAAIALHFALLSFGTGFTPIQSAFCFAVYAVFQLIPVQGIAGLGTQPARWVLALGAAGYKGPDIIALGIILHGTFYLFIAVMALFASLIWLTGRKSSP